MIYETRNMKSYRDVYMELFGPSTRDRKLLILGRFHRFRTVSAKVSTTGKGAAYNEI